MSRPPIPAQDSQAHVLLSVVVVSWNTRDLLAESLEAVQRAARRVGGPVEVIVVDNASTDGTTDMLAASESPMRRSILNVENRGFAGANNQGFEVARGHYVLMLNPDAVVGDDTLAHMLAFLEQHPRAGGAGPLVVGTDGLLQVSATPLPTLWNELWRLFHLDALKPVAAYPLDAWRQGGPRRVESLLGACVLLRRDVLRQVGPLDEQFFVYSEETDLCRRMHDAGWELYWLPGTSVLHHGGQSTRQVARSMFVQLYRSKVLYFRKHTGRAGAWTYKAILAAASVARLVGAGPWFVLSRAARPSIGALVRNYATLLRVLPAL